MVPPAFKQRVGKAQGNEILHGLSQIMINAIDLAFLKKDASWSLISAAGLIIMADRFFHHDRVRPSIAPQTGKSITDHCVTGCAGVASIQSSLDDVDTQPGDLSCGW